jgi:hypothetical protein
MKEPYIIIPKSLWADDRFTPIERMIISYRIGFGENYKVKNQTVAKDFGVSERKVEQTFQLARQHGLIQPEQLLMDNIMRESGSFYNQNCPNKYSGSPNKRSGETEQIFGQARTNVRVKNAILPMKTESLYNSNTIDNNIDNNMQKTIKSSEASFDIIIQGSRIKLKSYHRIRQGYEDKLNPEYLYVCSKGWWLGLSKDDYDIAAKSLANNQSNN